MTVEHHLRRVDGLLRHVEDELARTWAEVTRGVDDDFVHEWFPPLVTRLTRDGGKRLRPTMSYLGWRASGGGEDEAPGYDDLVHVGAGLDLLHAFALTHDDVMDSSTLRRGRPTAHVEAARAHPGAGALGDAGRFGESVAVLIGDLIFAEAANVTACLPAPMRAVWRTMLVELMAGQLCDLTGAAMRRNDAQHALAVARAKSGAYSIERPLELGALAARGGEAVRNALRRYGRNLGEAFALRDDLLGAFGDPAETGKPVGDDLVEGKATLLLSYATASLDGADARLLSHVGTDGLTPGRLAALQDAIVGHGVVERVERVVGERVEAAIAALDPDVVAPDAIPELSAMAERVAWRTS